MMRAGLAVSAGTISSAHTMQWLHQVIGVSAMLCLMQQQQLQLLLARMKRSSSSSSGHSWLHLGVCSITSQQGGPLVRCGAWGVSDRSRSSKRPSGSTFRDRKSAPRQCGEAWRNRTSCGEKWCLIAPPVVRLRPSPFWPAAIQLVHICLEFQFLFPERMHASSPWSDHM